MTAVKSHARRLGLLFGLTALSVVMFCQNAFAVAQDYSDVTSDISTEVTAALPVALGAVSLVIGVTVAYRIIRKILRA